MVEIYQDQVTIIGKVEKLDSLRVGRTGLSSYYLVVSIPNPKANRPIYIPCTIYSKGAEDLEKQVLNGTIKIGEIVECLGSHMNQYKDNKPCLEIKLKSITKYKENINLFGEE